LIEGVNLTYYFKSHKKLISWEMIILDILISTDYNGGEVDVTAAWDAILL
jgi:hypothetical protein